ncbi:class I SAM-dependent methyltransferase [Euzebyella marina]|uniref:Class I SAM-dependent methyltransferase n=1 Tax=Euzebyella marina TaxID=1761453 RepID=A0A3G2L1D0_9FLAO|nr:class I SAM-dependent methyltransferase [Euzebyella marina]AYN66070.1 class I SAM-dependent methyltransferase [Euzebyella marina]
MKPYLKTKDFSVTGESFELLHDSELDMLVTHPKPKNLDVYYASKEYISHTDSNESFVDQVYQLVKKFSLRSKLSLVSKYANNNKSLLDIGAGTGDFALTAKRSGWSAFGVEPNVDARLRSREKRMELVSDISELPKRRYQVITLWHVLEHLPNLESDIARIKNLLEDDGTLVIAVPNFKSRDAEHYQEHWAAYDVPRHLWHFSATAIERLFQKHEMQLIKKRPMWFDAFYVSLLSEKYQSGKQNLVKAFFQGLKSNWQGIRTGEFSSMIYILQKS